MQNKIKYKWIDLILTIILCLTTYASSARAQAEYNWASTQNRMNKQVAFEHRLQGMLGPRCSQQAAAGVYESLLMMQGHPKMDISAVSNDLYEEHYTFIPNQLSGVFKLWTIDGPAMQACTGVYTKGIQANPYRIREECPRLPYTLKSSEYINTKEMIAEEIYSIPEIRNIIKTVLLYLEL